MSIKKFYITLLCFLTLAPGAFASEKWALLIGINDYEDRGHIASLGAADNDARKLKAVLKETLGFPEANITLLVSDGDEKPTRANIVNALAHLSENAKAGDTVFVFYSGHGTEIEGKTYLLPHDFRGQNKFSATETGLEVARFNEMLKQVKAQALVMAWDMCRNNPFPTGKGAAATRKPMPSTKSWNNVSSELKPRDGAPPISVDFFACSTGETSFEWVDKSRGYFAYFLEKGMRGEAADAQGNVTLGSLAKYVQREVPRITRAQEGTAQTPEPTFVGADASEFVLARGKSAADPLPMPKIPEAAKAPDPNPEPERKPVLNPEAKSPPPSVSSGGAGQILERIRAAYGGSALAQMKPFKFIGSGRGEVYSAAPHRRPIPSCFWFSRRPAATAPNTSIPRQARRWSRATTDSGAGKRKAE